MDEAAARLYCEARLRKRNYPPTVDIDDLVQEYLLAELEGKCPKKAVWRVLRVSARDARHIETNHRMTFAVDDEQDVSITEEEKESLHEQALAIAKRVTDRQMEFIRVCLKQLLPQSQRAIELRMNGASVKAIARDMGVTEKQARYFVESGMERMNELDCMELVGMDLFEGLKDLRPKKRETYKRHTGPRYRPQEPTLLDAG